MADVRLPAHCAPLGLFALGVFALNSTIPLKKFWSLFPNSTRVYVVVFLQVMLDVDADADVLDADADAIESNCIHIHDS